MVKLDVSNYLLSAINSEAEIVLSVFLIVYDFIKFYDFFIKNVSQRRKIGREILKKKYVGQKCSGLTLKICRSKMFWPHINMLTWPSLVVLDGELPNT